MPGTPSSYSYKQALDRDLRQEPVCVLGHDQAPILGKLCIPKREIIGKVILLHEIEGNRNGAINILQHLAYALAREGIVSLRMDFSGHGFRKDQWRRFTPSNCIADVCHVLDYLDERYPGFEKTGITGASTGGSIALLAAMLDVAYSKEHLFNTPSRRKSRIDRIGLLAPVVSYEFNFLRPVTGWAQAVFTERAVQHALNDKDGSRSFHMFERRFGSQFIKDCQVWVELGDVNAGLVFALDAGAHITLMQGKKDWVLHPKIPQILHHMYVKKRGADKAGRFNLVMHKDMGHWAEAPWRAEVIDTLTAAMRPLQPPGNKGLEKADPMP